MKRVLSFLVVISALAIAAGPVAGEQCGHRRAVEAHRSMDLRWEAGRLGPEDRVVAASFSGRTPRTVEAARLARRAGARVWAITGNPDSPVAKAADRVLL